MRDSKRRGSRRVELIAALVLMAAGLCAVSGSAVTARAPAFSGVPGARAAVADTRTSAERPINVDMYQKCADPSTWVGTSHPLNPVATYLGGWADAQKLNGSMVLGSPEPAMGRSAGTGEGREVGSVAVAPDVYLCTLITMQLDYHGLRELPPSRATFLAYGFMPVTATVQLVQPGPKDFSACVEPDGSTSSACPPVTAVIIDHVSGPSGLYNTYQVVATAPLSLRISNVTVNGKPLAVGGSCQAGPVTTPGNPIGYDGTVLTGGDVAGDPEPQYANPLAGGAVDGSVAIPAVSGCGPGGNLDPLITSAISGTGNYTKLTQAPLCTNGGDRGTCLADGITPAAGPLWTVMDGGPYSGSGSSVSHLPGGYAGQAAIKCADSTASGSLPDFSGPPRGVLGTFHLTFGDCAGYNTAGTPDGTTWTVAQQGTGYIDGVQSGTLIDAPGTETLKFTQVSLVYRGWGGATGGTEQNPCQVVQAGSEIVTYTNPAGSSPAVLAPTAVSATGISPLMDITSSTCKNVPFFTNQAGGNFIATYPLKTGSGITITNLPPPSS